MAGKVCRLCGNPLQGGRKYCPSCGKKRQEETRRAAHARRKAGTQKKMNLPSVLKTCGMCGKEFTAPSKRFQYCEECVKKRAALASRKARTQTKSITAQARRARKAPRYTIEQAVKRLEQLNTERKAQGKPPLSYGNAVQKGLI